MDMMGRARGTGRQGERGTKGRKKSLMVIKSFALIPIGCSIHG